jgi:hypothetical protein
MDPGGKIYTTDQFRCWKVENLDDEKSDENKNEVGRYRVVFEQYSTVINLYVSYAMAMYCLFCMASNYFLISK